MSWLPISQLVPQYTDINGVPAVGYVLKFYASGTTTNINMATDSTGGTERSDITLNSQGNPEDSGTTFIPHLDQQYKIAFYPNQAAADTDTGAIWMVDDISPALPAFEDVTISGNNTHSGNNTFSGTNTFSGANTFSGVSTVSGVSNHSASVNLSEGSAVASAATTDIWATDGNTVHVTGTTTITSLGTAPNAGAMRRVIFDGALTLTHAANLNIPGGENITTSAGDSCIVYADTTTQLDIFDYIYADGRWNITTLQTAQATTSGTSINFTSIPSWVTEIKVIFDTVSLSGVDNMIVQIGDSGGLETTGYAGRGLNQVAGTETFYTFTTGFGIPVDTATDTIAGIMTICLVDSSNTWVASSMLAGTNTSRTYSSAGKKALTGTLDRLSLTTVLGSNTFDSGQINIKYS